MSGRFGRTQTCFWDPLWPAGFCSTPSSNPPPNPHWRRIQRWTRPSSSPHKAFDFLNPSTFISFNTAETPVVHIHIGHLHEQFPASAFLITTSLNSAVSPNSQMRAILFAIGPKSTPPPQTHSTPLSADKSPSLVASQILTLDRTNHFAPIALVRADSTETSFLSQPAQAVRGNADGWCGRQPSKTAGCAPGCCVVGKR
jgi:hypothetical protein